jgi:DNA-binding NtrC family response regulator
MVTNIIIDRHMNILITFNNPALASNPPKVKNVKTPIQHNLPSLLDFLKDNKNFNALLLEYTSDKTSKKEPKYLKSKVSAQITQQVLDPDTTFMAQANSVLGKISKIVKRDEVIKIIPDNFPAGLFEQLFIVFKDYQEVLPPLQLFEFLQAAKVNIPWEHKNRSKYLDWQDKEFRLDLYDEEERRDIEKALRTTKSVLLTGTRGSGKTLLARYIHYHTDETANGLFKEVSLPAITGSLFESEFFGVKKRAVTDVEARAGLLEEADNGTLFLDEIAETSPPIQTKLLRVISERIEPFHFRKIGGEDTTVKVRFIAATNVSEEKLSNKLRNDLQDRFALRIHLKNIDEKKPDAFDFFFRAILHYTQLCCINYPQWIPEWEKEGLRYVLENHSALLNFRNLQNFVNNVFDSRKVEQRATNEKVTKDEIMRVLQEHAMYSRNKGEKGLSPVVFQSALENLVSVLEQIDRADNVQGINNYREQQIKDFIFKIKKTALLLSRRYAPESIVRAMKIYGMGNLKSYKELLSNPLKLHPDREARE